MNQYIEEVLKNEFKIDVKSSVFIGEGWMSKAFLVNNNWIFRFPKTNEGSKDLIKEAKLLPLINRTLSIETPVFEFMGEQENGLKFVGYKSVAGDFHNLDSFLSFTNIDNSKFIDDLANVMNLLNSVEVSDRSLNVEITNDLKKEYEEIYSVFESNVFSLLNQKIINKILKIYTNYIRNDKNFKYNSKLIHADISFEHLIFDTNTNKLKGLIDFGDLMLSDPDFEYMYILDDFGLDFIIKLMKKRNQTDIAHSIEKVKFYLLSDNISIILEGTERRDDNMIKDGIALVENSLKILYKNY